MIVDSENLEKLLVSNWTQFVDPRLLRKFVQNEVPKHLNNFINIASKKGSINTNSLSLSKFQYVNDGYLLWIEFTLLLENSLAEGTIEAFIARKDENINLISINGNKYEI